VEAVQSPGQARTVVNARPDVTALSAGAGPGPAGETATAPACARGLGHTFRGERSQVPLARDLARRVLAGHACPAAALEDILSCLAELAANAVIHSRSGQPGGQFTVQIDVRDGQWVRVAVEDDGGPWQRRDIGDDAECGRGLQIVTALSAEMGITGDDARRTVWFRCPWTPAPSG
jgi:serine/threonine-protein kinase RsbW